ncbi:hypothetical protein ASG11_04195 [Sphingomonas sp. Leaf357]|nr:hypothetical protein ASG11_04195 [Sphingomonas sp. Leaf357]
MDWYNGWSPEDRCATLPDQRQAIRDGRIAKPTRCSICGFAPADHLGTTNTVWLHDENYADPLAAYHVCRSCHRTLHDRFDHPQPWRELVARYGTGGRWFELLTMDQASLRRPFGLTYPNGLPPN